MLLYNGKGDRPHHWTSSEANDETVWPNLINGNAKMRHCDQFQELIRVVITTPFGITFFYVILLLRIPPLMDLESFS